MNSDGDAFTYDHAGLQQAIQLEQDAGFDIQIGGRPAQPRPIDPVQLQIQLTKVRLFSVLFVELHHVLTQANLGAGLDSALDMGRMLNQQKLIFFSSDQIQVLAPLCVNQSNENSDLIQNQVTQALDLSRNLQAILFLALRAISPG